MDIAETVQGEVNVGLDTANFLEVLAGKTTPGYEPRNWDPTEERNRFEGKSPTQMVDEFISAGHQSLDLLLRRVLETEEQDGKSPFYREVVDALKQRIESSKDKTT